MAQGGALVLELTRSFRRVLTTDAMAFDKAAACATFCAIMSAVGVVLMVIFGYLCTVQSPSMEIPEKNKPAAGQGCFMAAGLYALTFGAAYTKMGGKKSE